MPDGNGLAGDAPSLDVHLNVELVSSPGEFQWLPTDHFTGLSAEVVFNRPLVDDKLPFSGFKPNPCDGGFSLASGINGFRHFLSLLLLKIRVQSQGNGKDARFVIRYILRLNKLT